MTVRSPYSFRSAWLLSAALFWPTLRSQTIVSGTYNAAAITGNITVSPSTSATFNGGTTFSGTTATIGSNAGIYWQQTGTLTGKTISLGSGGYLYVNGANNALTLGPTTSVTGDLGIYSSGSAGTAITNQGTLTHTGGSSSIYAPTFTNSGAISATAGTLYLGYPNTYNSTNSSTGTVTADGATVYLRGNFANNGVLTAKNSGVLFFDGTNTTGNLGNVQLQTSGRARLNGTLTNTALAAPTGGSFDLYGGTISGGTIAAGALAFTSSGGYLDGATLSDNLSLAASSYVRFTGGASFTGATATLANNAGLYWEQVGTLAGKTFTLGSGAYLYVNGTNNALTLGPTTSVTGDLSIYSSGSAGTAITNQGTLTHTGGSSSIYAPTFTNSGAISATAGTLYLGYPNTYNSTNSATGTVTADGATVYLRGNFANNGVLTAKNSGVLFFDGTNTTGNLGNVQLQSGGRARLNGTLTNTALAAPTGGSFDLYGGTVSGGTIAAGALAFTSSGGYLDGATLSDNLSIAASSYVRFTGGASFTGATASLANNAGLYWEQVGTLTGKTFTLGSGAYLYVNGTNNALTLGPTTSVTGDLSIYSSGSAGTAITNQGTLTHTGGSSSIYAPTFTNSGAISATAGTLYLGYPNTYNSTNSATGTVTADGATVYLRGNFANNGVLTAKNSGVLFFDGTNTTGNLGNVQLQTSGRARLNGTLTNTALAAPTGGSFDLYGGTISGGTIAAGALAFTSSGGYLDGATLSDNLAIAASSYVRFTGGASFTGATATLANNAGLYWEQVGTLTGKTFTLGSGAYLYVNGTNNALTLGPTTSVTGDLSIYSSGSAGTAITNQGTLSHTGGSSSIYAPTFTNSGAISATAGTLYLGYPNTYNSTNSATGTVTADGATVYLRGNFANNGVLTAKNSGVLFFDGTNTTGNLGNVQLQTSGRARLNGTLTNTALAAPTGGSFDLYGGTISGGTIAVGALAFTSSGGYLDGATLSDNLSIAASSYVRFTGGASFTGATASLANNAGLYWEQVGTLAGKTFTLGSGAYLYVNGTNNALTLGPTTSVTGDLSIYSSGSAGTAITNQGTLTHTGGSSSIYAPTFTNSGAISATAGTLYLGYPNTYNSTNSSTGTVTADGATVYLRGNFANNGVLTAKNSGVLFFDGTNTTGNLGNVQLQTGGRARLNGTLTNTGGTLNAPTGGSFELYGGTITGGNVAAGALTYSSSGGYLDGVALAGNQSFPASSYVRFLNNTTLGGTSATFGSSAGVYWQQAGTLTGNALSFGSSAYLYVNGVNNTLTLDATSSVTGDVTLYTDGSAGTAITNQGTLTHNTGSGTLYGRTFTNSGTIIASSGSLNLGSSSTGYSFANTASGNITVAGGTIALNAPTGSPIVNQGTINVQSGTLFTNNDLTNGATGTISGAGTINGGLTVAGGRIAPGNSIGTLTLTSGAFAVTSASTFAVELGGATADQLVFQNPVGTVNLGAGLLTLSLTLLSPPTDNTTYNLIRISAGGSGISGTFAGLPTSGSLISSTYNGGGYTFAVNYQTNLVSLSFTTVPEPSTWAMLTAGLALVVIARRRRHP